MMAHLPYEFFSIGGAPFDSEPGWFGAFTRAQAPGAMPNGSPIIKAASEKGDSTPGGTRGVVLGSFKHPEVMGGATLYFVEWSNRPRVACAVIDWKIKHE
jgi:hypothetical protein